VNVRGVIFAVVCTLAVAVPAAVESLEAYVDPAIGTRGTGTEYGGTMPMTGEPFGSMHVVPMTRMNGVGRTSYNADDPLLLGFVLTRQPAVWMGDWGEVRVLLPEPEKILSRAFAPDCSEIVTDRRRVRWTATAHATLFEGLVDCPDAIAPQGVNTNRMDAPLGYPLPHFGGRWKAFWLEENGIRKTLGVGVSLISVEQATRMLSDETYSLDFEMTRKRTAAQWQAFFDRVKIETDDADVKKIFATALYHALLYPRDVTEYGSYYSAFDDRVHPGTSYTCFSLWDTYRAEHPLLTLVAPERVGPMMQSLVQDFQEGGWLPKWPNPSYTGIMAGAPAEIVLAEAMAKGFGGFDHAVARAAIRKNATLPQEGDGKRRWADRERNGRTPETRGGLKSYLERGYVACDETAESVSRTLDFAFADRSRAYTNLWNAAARRFLPRKADGSWKTDPSGRYWGDYTECSLDTALWCVPHDVEGLVGLLGGPEAFERELDRYFADVFFKPNGEGLTLHGNEPTHHTAYLYNRIGKYDKTIARVRKILSTCYTADARGFDGNEDCGAMSAWYILSALGLYMIDPPSAMWDLGCPIVRRAELDVGGKKLVIRTTGGDPRRGRVVCVSFDGRPIPDRRIADADLRKGGELVFTCEAGRGETDGRTIGR